MTSTDTLPLPAGPGPARWRSTCAGCTSRFGTVPAVDGIDLDDRARRGRRVPRPERRRQDHDDRHAARPGRARRRLASRCSGCEPGRAIAEGRVSAVMQSGGLLKDLTVGETVELTASFFRSARSVDEVLARAGIADIADRKVGKCSGGQQQRLRFALALLPDPDVIVLDEPTTGMDVEGRRDFWTAMRADAARGRTILFATHYLEEADAYADRIVLVRRGRIVADGSAAEIKTLASGRIVTATLPDLTAAEDAALRALPGVAVGRASAATASWCTRPTPTASRATCSPPPRRTTSRSPRATSRTRSSPSPRPSGSPRMSTVARRTDHLDRAPRTGLVNGPFLAIELRRLLRNRRTVIFTLVMPPVFFLHLRHRPTRTRPRRSATATSPRTSWSRWRSTAPCSPRRAAARASRSSGRRAGRASCG